MSRLICSYTDNVFTLTEVWADESGWEIKYGPDGVFMLYELPLYGGEPRYINTYTNLHIAIADGRKMT